MGILTMANYTKVPKPTTGNYTNINTIGKEQYDQAALTYDSALTFYDGVNTNQYTFVARPRAGRIVAGMATGLITPPTYASNVGIDPYTRIPKPN